MILLVFPLLFNIWETYAFESSFQLNCQVIQALLGHKSMNFKDL